jgi:DNA modification methylase
VFKNGSAPHINNVELGRFGRSRSNIWNYAGLNTFGNDRDTELAMHPTVKPVALVADAILDCSNRGGIVLDAFAGSGTTLIAAEKTGRHGYGIEIDPYYVDTIINRFEAVYGVKAIHTGFNLDFAAVGRRRSEEKKDDGKRKRKPIKEAQSRRTKGRPR